MKVIRIGPVTNPTVRLMCPVCESLLECNYNELDDSGPMLKAFCPVCGMIRPISNVPLTGLDYES